MSCVQSMVRLCSKPRTGTSTDLLSTANFYVAMLLIPACHFCPPPDVHPWGKTAPATYLYTSPTFFSPNRIILPPGLPLSLSQNTNIIHSLIHIPLPPPIFYPCHACLIPDDVPFPLTKSLLTLPSAVFEPPFSFNAAHGASPLPHSPSTYSKPHILVSTPPTPPLTFDVYQYTSPVSGYPLI